MDDTYHNVKLRMGEVRVTVGLSLCDRTETVISSHLCNLDEDLRRIRERSWLVLS